MNYRIREDKRKCERRKKCEEMYTLITRERKKEREMQAKFYEIYDIDLLNGFCNS